MGRLWRILKAALSGFFANDALSRGAAIAFYAATSLAPVLLIVVAIAGLAFGQDGARAAISDELGQLLGPAGGDFIKSILARSSDPASGTLATILGVLTVVITASGVFGEMHTALNATFKAKPIDEPISALIRTRAASLGLVAALGFMLVVSLAASAGLSALGLVFQGWFGGKILLAILNSAVSLSIFTVLFTAIYKVLPDTAIPWRELVLGAFVTAVLFTVGKSLIGIYLGRAAPSSPYGAAGALIVLMFWTYYSAQIFLFGAELTKAIADERAPADRQAREGTIQPSMSSLSNENDEAVTAMTRSVEELRRESERNRAELAATVDRLRAQITDTAEDLRYKVSPQGIKSEVSEFVSRKSQGWLEALKQQAMENPMQTIAAGTAVAVPALRLARSFPLPLLMIGAGLALTSKTVRARAAEAATPAMEKAREMAGEAAERVQSIGEDAVNAASETSRRATDGASEAHAKAAGMADDLKDRAARATDKVKAGVDAASETAKDKIEQVRSTMRDKATAAPETTRQMVRDNAALIAGLGVAIGAIIAASLPDSKAEAVAIGKASDSAKRAAGKVAQSGFETAKDAVLSAADAAAKSVSQADLGQHASRMTRDVSERLKEAADDIVTAAFNPSRTEEKSS
jgi:YihY family inner membrane protein